MSTSTGVPLTSLPGVRRWLRRVRDDLRAGRSCLWLLPRGQTFGPDCVADVLLAELLHELGDFILLPEGRVRAIATPTPSALAQVSSMHWSGLAPMLDYDDGMSGFGTSSVAVATPAPKRPATPAECLAELLNRLAGELADPAQPPTDWPRPITDRAESSPADGVLARLVGKAAGSAELRPIVIQAWREETPFAAANFLRRLTATAKEAGLSPARRPRALVVATAEDLPPDLPDQLGREEIAVHWWWGAISRLDTATVVAINRPPTSSPAGRQQLLEAVVQATIVELCGPFLDVAATLAANWSGSSGTLDDSLRQAVAETVADDLGPLGRREGAGGPGHRPSNRELASWSSGLVDNWDGNVRCHPAGDLAHRNAVTTRIWLAQHHALLPRLDDAREDFARVVSRRARIPLPQLVQQYGPQHIVESPASAVGDGDAGVTLAAMELGSMWGAHIKRDIILEKDERRRLRILWESRNRLAHRTPLDEARLRDLVAELGG